MAKLDQHICFLLDVATRQITKFYNRRLRRFGITYNHLFILTCLWEQEGMNVKDLAQQLCWRLFLCFPLQWRCAAQSR